MRVRYPAAVFVPAVVAASVACLCPSIASAGYSIGASVVSWVSWLPLCVLHAIWPTAEDCVPRVRCVWPFTLLLALAAPPLFALLPAALAALPVLPLLQLPGRVLPLLPAPVHHVACALLLLLRIQVLRFCTELAVVYG